MEKIGIIGAMEVEVERLKTDMEIQTQKSKAGMEFCEGLLMGQKVVVVRSGVGKVNAAICSQILVSDFGVDAIINTGIAGSLQSAINIGDIVVSSDVVHHDVDATGFGYPLGQIPQMDVFSFRSDERMKNLAKEVCQEVNQDINVFVGRVVSGDQFISNRRKKLQITESFGGYCTEMEGAAIAQTAWLNQIPFVIVRAISDKADDSATVDYPTFEAKAIEHSVKLVERMMVVLQ